ncbi:hypothetical protein [Natrinema versiforme]|uniref:Uncharacterized protein n=1 Tax=Natrinema versiforme TaxID=88724 RepID=A0A4P8WIQ0_9EURY|nr:hypothetical protein [Natrinema versiforme]QCS43085.1 hypothetical protein FEJ81_12230 [Natrinema versiforme]
MSRKRTRRGGKSRRPRTISISLDRRGQTTQDFAIGIGVFLLAIAFVFSFLPTVVTPFDSSISGAETAQADRIADRIVHNTSTGSGNEIDPTAFNTTYANGDLTENLSLRSSNGHQIDNVNISIETFGDSATIDEQANRTSGDVYDEQAAASSARIVTIKDGSGNCDPACRLVVRVW